MKYFNFLVIVVALLIFSCNKKNAVNETIQAVDTLQIASNKIVNTIGETLIPNAKKAVSDWKEYNDVDDFIIRYYNISTTEALSNSKELSELVAFMKDSVRVEKLKELNVTARINVLHNETLRLNDMSEIPSISTEEVKEEVTKILEVYSALNSKINTIYKIEDIQKSLEIDTETPVEIIEEPEPIKRNSRISSKKM